MDAKERFRAAHRECMARVQEAVDEFAATTTALIPGNRIELELYQQTFLESLSLRLALFGLSIDNLHTASTKAIWTSYKEYLDSRVESGKTGREPRQQRSKKVRRRILDTAITRILQGEQVTTTVICEELGVAIGSAYDYFGDTNGLIAEAYAEIFESLIGDDANDDPQDQPGE